MIHLGAFIEGISHMAWQQDTTVLDSAVQVANSALQGAIVDTIFVAVGGGWATAAPIIASIVGAAAAVAITWFAWATHSRDTKDREERTRATDTRVSVRAYYTHLLLNNFINKFPSRIDEAFDWARDFRAGSGPLQTDIQRLAEEIPGASTPVSKAIRLAYVNFNAATVRITRATNQSELSTGLDYSTQAYLYLKKCAHYLLQAVDDGLKSAAAGVAHALRGSVTASAKVTGKLTYSAEEDSPNQDGHLDD